jgi:hypothetical protein
MTCGLNNFGIGDSKTNLLFWAASRSAPPVGYVDEVHEVIFNATIEADSNLNIACDAQGLHACIFNHLCKLNLSLIYIYY